MLKVKKLGRGNRIATNSARGGKHVKMFTHVPKFRLELENIRIYISKPHMYFVYDVRKNKPLRLEPVFKLVHTQGIWHLKDLNTNDTLHTLKMVADLIRYTDKNIDKLTRGKHV